MSALAILHLVLLGVSEDERHRQQWLVNEVHTAVINAGVSPVQLAATLHRQDARTSAAIVQSLLEYKVTKSRMSLTLNLQAWEPMDDPELLKRQRAAVRGFTDWLESCSLQDKLASAVLSGLGGERESEALSLVEQWVGQDRRGP